MKILAELTALICVGLAYDCVCILSLEVLTHQRANGCVWKGLTCGAIGCWAAWVISFP